MEPHVTGSEVTQVTPYLQGRCKPCPHIEGSAGPSSRAVGTRTTWDLGTLKASCLVQVYRVNQPLEADCISHGSLEKQNLSSICMCIYIWDLLEWRTSLVHLIQQQLLALEGPRI